MPPDRPQPFLPPGPADLWGFGRDLLLLLGVPLAAIVGLIFWWSPWPDKFDLATPEAIFAAVEGDWYWKQSGSCATRYHSIGFDSPHTVMTILSHEPATDTRPAETDTTVYDILSHGTHHVRGAIRGETRTTPLGNPVVWDLILTGPGSYQWKQAGVWGVLGYTGKIARCERAGSESWGGDAEPGG